VSGLAITGAIIRTITIATAAVGAGIATPASVAAGTDSFGSRRNSAGNRGAGAQSSAPLRFDVTGLPGAGASPISRAFKRLRSLGVPDLIRDQRIVRVPKRSEAVKGARPDPFRSQSKGTNMALYEHLLIARQDISAQQVDALATHLKTIVEGEGGKVEKQEYWGLRGLAYRIKKNRKGHYVLLNINAPAKAVVELERQLKINEDVLRYITVSVDAFEVSSNKNRRDDRPEGERKPEGIEAEAAL